MRALAILMVLASLPALIFWLKEQPARLRLAAWGLGFLPFAQGFLQLDAALISWALWPGHTRGLVLTVLDTLALAIVITSRNRIGMPPFQFFFLFYVLSAAVSVFQAPTPMGATFFAFQLLRVYIVFLAAYTVVTSEYGARWIYNGIAYGAIFQAVFSIWQKLNGADQASGTVGHQNLLGMMLHFSTLPLLALVLAGDKNPVTRIGVLAGLVAASLTGSRGTIGFLAMGIVALLVLSMIRKSTPLKWRTLGLGVLLSLAIVPVAMSSLEGRTEQQKASSNAEREAFERAANLMWDENPMGVGANHYVVVANVGGYSDRAGVIATWGSRSAHVHNVYLLHAAEMGWLGLISFSALIFLPAVRGIFYSILARNNPDGDLVLGVSVAMIVAAVHGLYEWILIYYPVLCFIAISTATIAAAVSGAGAKTSTQNGDLGGARKSAGIVEEVMR